MILRKDFGTIGTHDLLPYVSDTCPKCGSEKVSFEEVFTVPKWLHSKRCASCGLTRTNVVQIDRSQAHVSAQ